jgi:hypothetical protein
MKAAIMLAMARLDLAQSESYDAGDFGKQEYQLILPSAIVNRSKTAQQTVPRRGAPKATFKSAKIGFVSSDHATKIFQTWRLLQQLKEEDRTLDFGDNASESISHTKKLEQNLSEFVSQLTMESVSIETMIESTMKTLKMTIIPQCCVHETSSLLQAESALNNTSNHADGNRFQTSDVIESEAGDEKNALDLVENISRYLNSSVCDTILPRNPSEARVKTECNKVEPAVLPPPISSYMERMYCALVEVRGSCAA